MDARAKAKILFEAVKSGHTVFTRAKDCWMIIGPAADLRIGQSVTVTKADGTTTVVYPTIHNNTGTKLGLDYAVWEFSNEPAAHVCTLQSTGWGADDMDDEPAPRRRRGYTTVHSQLYGEGRVYRSQPGATQYDDGTGRYNVQIWDND